MDFNMSKYQAGYPGEDSMRSKAERMFRDEMAKGSSSMRAAPESASAPDRMKRRPYAEGGYATGGETRAEGGEMRRGGHKKTHVRRHPMPDYQTNEHFPRPAKKQRLNVESFREAEHLAEGGYAEGGEPAMRRGGHRRRYQLGGPLDVLGLAEGGDAMRRGGHRRKKHYDDGGSMPYNSSMGIPDGQPGGQEVSPQEAFMTKIQQYAADPRHPGQMPPQSDLDSAHFAEGGSSMRRGGRRRAEGGEMRAEGGEMRRGGHRRRRAEGGELAEGGNSYANGGGVYEREMLGEHPTHRRPHINYESTMRGEHPLRRAYAEGGYAEGGEPAMRRGGRRRAEGGELAEGGEMRRGGHRRKYGAGGAMLSAATGIPGLGELPFAEGGYAEGGNAMRRGGRRRAEGGELADGGEPAMRRGGRRRAEGGDCYGLGGALGTGFDHMFAEGGDARADGGAMRRGGHRRHRADGGETRADGGRMAMGGVGKIRHNQATRGGQPIRRKVNMDRTRYAEGGYAEGGEPAMRRGGRRRAEGGDCYGFGGPTDAAPRLIGYQRNYI